MQQKTFEYNISGRVTGCVRIVHIGICIWKSIRMTTNLRSMLNCQFNKVIQQH